MTSKPCILIAEDDLEDQFIMTDAFKEEGLEKIIRFVENGELAMKFLNTAVEHNNPPSLVVLDLNMPLLNGTQTLREIRSHQKLKDVPVIIYSTSLNLIEMEECRKLGANSYITKPNTFTECCEVARRFFEFCNGNYLFPSIEETITRTRSGVQI